MKRRRLPELRFTTPPAAADRAGAGGYFATTAHGPDLFKNAQTGRALYGRPRGQDHRMSREQAYCLCGAAVDLKISEIVDAPNWIVSAYLPLAIFKR